IGSRCRWPRFCQTRSFRLPSMRLWPSIHRANDGLWNTRLNMNDLHPISNHARTGWLRRLLRCAGMLIAIPVMGILLAPGPQSTPPVVHPAPTVVAPHAPSIMHITNAHLHLTPQPIARASVAAAPVVQHAVAPASTRRIVHTVAHNASTWHRRWNYTGWSG